MIIVVVYVDDIIFGRDLQIMSVNVGSNMKKEFEMYLLGELTFFLGLQVSQSEKWIKPSALNTCLRSLRWKNSILLVLLWSLVVS